LWSLALVAAVVATYAPLARAGFTWDDAQNVTDNLALRDLRGLGRIWFEPGATQQYYPVTNTTLWIDWQLSGAHALRYHLENIAFHIAAALLFRALLARLAIPGAWLAAFVFALHPVHVESVAWISERKNVVSLTFYLLTALAFLRFRAVDEEPPAAQSTAKRIAAWALATLLFTATLLAKVATCTEPAALLLVLWWKRRLRARDFGWLAPWLAIALVVGRVTSRIESSYVVRQGGVWALTPVTRLVLAGRALWFYAGKLVWPRGLMFFYPRFHLAPGEGWQALAPLAAVLVAVALFAARDRIGRGPVVAFLCYAGTLAPTLGFLDVYAFRYSYVADHWQYHASLAPIALAAAGAMALIEAEAVRARSPALRALAISVAALTVAALPILARAELPQYHDQESLYRAVISRNPDCSIAHNNLGAILQLRGDVKAAMPEHAAAAAADPTNGEALMELGHTLNMLGRSEEAIAPLTRAIGLKPWVWQGHSYYGDALAALKHYEQANGEYSLALRLEPELPGVESRFGITLALSGHPEEAVTHLCRSLRLNPDNTSAASSLAAMAPLLGGKVPTCPK
jgi:tetratricopeptide (TPR) repeat protein